MGDLTKNFSRHEFACKCGCGFDDIDILFVKYLQSIRDVVGEMVVISGCRCHDHNIAVGGVTNSAHLRGLAADIKVDFSQSRFLIVSLAAFQGINRIGIDKTFIHLDVDRSLPSPVLFLY